MSSHAWSNWDTIVLTYSSIGEGMLEYTQRINFVLASTPKARFPDNEAGLVLPMTTHNHTTITLLYAA